MPIYSYQHPETKEVFEEFRQIKDRNKPFVSKDGKKCKRVLFDVRPQKDGRRASRAGQKLEVFEADPEYVRKCNPKFIEFRDGHKEPFDPNRHC